MTEVNTAGRTPFEWVELVQDFCAETYGVSPCTATLSTGVEECYNTRASCQDPANYNLSSLTLKFCSNQVGIPTDSAYFPSLISVKVKPGSINPGGGNRNVSPFGTRSNISIVLHDHPYTDRIVDPYVDNRTFDPYERSTFWAKWRARNPYYLNRKIIYKTGYLIDGEVEADSVVSRTFLITGFNGPSPDGKVQIVGKDVLSLTADFKSEYPPQSSGKLSSDITDTDTSLTLTPSGVGATYQASGLASMGNEIVSFTRVGDNFTIVRSQEGTTADTHNADATFQECGVFVGKQPDEILYTVVSVGAGIPDANLDTAQWADEVSGFLPRTYTAVIPKPTGVGQLVSELSENMYFYPWTDEREDKVKIRAVRPPEDEEITDLDDERHNIKNSVVFSDVPDQVINQVIVHYNIINPTEKLDEPSNYASTEVIYDSGSASDERNRGVRRKVIFSRWIQNGAAAIEVGERLIQRYKDVPKRCSFELDAKDGQIWVGDFVRIHNRNAVGLTGLSEPVNIQVMSVEEIIVGSRFRYSGQQFSNPVPVDPDDRLIIISENQYNLNLRTLHDSVYTPPVGTEKVRFVVRAGVKIGGFSVAEASRIYTGSILVPGPTDLVKTSESLPVVQSRNYSGSYARGDTNPDGVGILRSDVTFASLATSMTTGSWPSGVVLEMLIEPGAALLGEGGNGCVHYAQDGSTEEYIVSDGGHAMEVLYPITIDNQGTISGGYSGGAAFVRTPVVYPGAGKIGVIIPGAGGLGFPGGSTVTNIIGNLKTGVVVSSDPGAGSSTARGSSGVVYLGEALLPTGPLGEAGIYDFWAYSGRGGAGIFGGLFSRSDINSYVVGKRRGFFGSYFNVTDSGTAGNTSPYGEVGATGDAVVSGGADITWTNYGYVYGTVNP